MTWHSTYAEMFEQHVFFEGPADDMALKLFVVEVYSSLTSQAPPEEGIRMRARWEEVVAQLVGQTVYVRTKDLHDVKLVTPGRPGAEEPLKPEEVVRSCEGGFP